MNTPQYDVPLLVVENLRRTFTLPQDWWDRVRGKPPPELVAVDGVDLRIAGRTTMALVGESGCGKSTVGRCILRLIEPTGGAVTFDTQDVLRLDGHGMRQLRRKMQFVFQDPYSSLNPRQTVAHMLGEVLAFHRLATTRHERHERVQELLAQVGLNPAHATRYPHEFSGGQRQRIGIARALAVEPQFIVCDEPVSALDVSVQAQIINLLEDLQASHGLTYLFISHDLSVVRHISSVVAVMYLGRIVEQAPTAALFEQAHHPYTQALLAAIPHPDPSRRRSHTVVRGEVVSELAGHVGCPFRNRCPHAMPHCATDDPPWQEVSPGHWSRCWL